MTKLSILLLFSLALNLFSLEIAHPTVIVSPADSPEVDKVAAGELQYYLKQITGNELMIVSKRPKDTPAILIGLQSGEQWKEDEIKIDMPDEQTLILTGAPPRGARYAVSTFLQDHCGVLFLSPDFEVIPPKKKLVFSRLRCNYAPQCVYRQPGGLRGRVPAGWKFYTRLKINGNLYCKPITQELGGAYQMKFGHALDTKRGYVKTKDYFSAHPEYFAYRRDTGKRTPDSLQLCLSNPNARRLVVEKALEERRQNPDWQYLAVGAADNSNICQCKDCIKLYQKYQTFAAGHLLTANEMAQALHREYPGTRVMFLAYGVTLLPPRNLPLEPNLWIGYAHLGRNHGKKPSEGNLLHNINFRRWCELASGRIIVWDYYANFRYYPLPLPLSPIAAGLKEYAGLGSRGAYIQLPGTVLGDFIDYRIWLCAQLLWNPQLNEKILFHTFFDHYYGKGAPFIKEYAVLRETAFARQPEAWISCYHRSVLSWLTETDLLKSLELIESAVKATADTPEIQAHIRKVKAGLILAIILDYSKVKRKAEQLDKILPDRNTMIRDFMNLQKEFNEYSLSESVNIKRVKEWLRPAKLPGTSFRGGKNSKGIATLITPPIGEGATTFWNARPQALTYTFDEGMDGRQHMTLVLRAEGIKEKLPLASQVMVFSGKNEIAHIDVPECRDWTSVSLGTFDLPPGSQILVYPGQPGFEVKIEIKELILK